VEQKLPTLPEHLSSPPVCSGVLDTQSLVYNVCFVDHCLKEPLVNVFPTEKKEILGSYSFSCVPLLEDLLIPNCYKKF
jgi:hypothetical protein